MKLAHVCNRLYRTILGKKGIYCNMKKGNHFSEGVLIYENATIGSYNYFAPYVIANNVKIGNYCSIGPGCKIGLGEHDMSAISMRPIIANGDGCMELFDLSKPTLIGNDVWLGANVIVRQGVHIGNGSIIAAGAVVINDVPPYSIVGGVPAKIIKYRFSPDIIEKLNILAWWDKDEQWIIKHADSFDCVEHLLKDLSL